MKKVIVLFTLLVCVFLTSAIIINADENEEYHLQYNYVMNNGEWSDHGGDYYQSYKTYNCYAYAIGRYDFDRYFGFNIVSGNPERYNPGDIAVKKGVTPIDRLLASDRLAADVQNIINDLNALHYYDVATDTEIPNVEELSSNEYLICIRDNSHGFHLMRYDKETNCWYHKPGDSAILKYKYVPDRFEDWYGEYSQNGKCYLDPYSDAYYYSGPITFISFKKPTLYLSSNDNISTKSFELLRDNDDYVLTLDVQTAGEYKLSFNCNNALRVKLYDYEWNAISTYDISANSDLYFQNNNLLNDGKYYLKVLLNDNSVTSTNVTVSSENISPILFHDYSNNCLNYLYEISPEYKSTRIRYVHHGEDGLYRLCLSSNNTNSFPYESIKILNSSLNIMNRLSFDEDDNNLAINEEGTNNFFIYLQSNETYYIDLCIPNIKYTNLNLSFSNIGFVNFDYSNRMTSHTLDEIFTSTYCDMFTKINITHPINMSLSIDTNGSLRNNINVYVYRLYYDSTLGEYVYDRILDEYITENNLSPIFNNLILNKGIYIVGYLNNNDSASVSFLLERNINQNIDIYNTLITDMNDGVTLGSEVVYNNGIYNGNTITEGFTRNIYFDITKIPNLVTQSVSRLDYYWYSSDESVATVSNYGTVFGKSVVQDTVVYIYAIYKNDPSIVYKKEFVILNETQSGQLFFNDSQIYSLSESGNIYNLELTFDNSPYPLFQYYNWNIIIPTSTYPNLNVTINYWGMITTNGTGGCTIYGVSIYNPRIVIVIEVFFNA